MAGQGASGRIYVDLITGMSNAVITVDQSWIDHGTAHTVLGVRSRVLAAEGEASTSKLFVIRERFDGADIVHIIHGTKGRLDWTRLPPLVGEHWELLLWELILFRYIYPSKQHYIPREVWQLLLTDLQAQLNSSSPTPAFRGSLIDERMFAIDVHEWGLENLLQEQRARRRPTIGKVTAAMPPSGPRRTLESRPSPICISCLRRDTTVSAIR